MFTRTLSIVALTSLITVLFTISQANAVLTQVVHQDVTPHCDPLFIPLNVDEIGDLLYFPPGEQLESEHMGDTQFAVCSASDNPNMTDALVTMTNLTGRDLTEVWYIANKETTISNYDGYANDITFPITAADIGQEAFRIDHVLSDPGGSHHPLISESGPFDGIWQAGETWVFILQDYVNALGIGPDVFTTLGVGDASSFTPGVVPQSSGSIIATPVPEPSSMCLVLITMGGLGTMLARRRKMRASIP